MRQNSYQSYIQLNHKRCPSCPNVLAIPVDCGFGGHSCRIVGGLWRVWGPHETPGTNRWDIETTTGTVDGKPPPRPTAFLPMAMAIAMAMTMFRYSTNIIEQSVRLFILMSGDA
jgi:hypothetical protein